jgi:toxin ParE1/3/4
MTVIYSPRSRRDLEKIHAYIVLESEGQANRFIGRLLNACEMLKIFPERFPAYPYARHWKMMPFGNYLVFFQIHEGEVRIGHIRHAARKSFGG